MKKNSEVNSAPDDKPIRRVNPSAQEMRMAQVSVIRAITPGWQDIATLADDMLTLHRQLKEVQEDRFHMARELATHNEFLPEMKRVCTELLKTPQRMEKRVQLLRAQFEERAAVMESELAYSAEDLARLEREWKRSDTAMSKLHTTTRKALAAALSDKNDMLQLLPAEYRRELRALLKKFKKDGSWSSIGASMNEIRHALDRQLRDPRSPVRARKPKKPTESKERVDVYMHQPIRKDIPPMLMMETLSSDDPLNEKELRDMMRQRNNIALVADSPQGVMGYVVYEEFPGYLRILKFVVHPLHRRKCIGEQMVGKLVGKLSIYGKQRLSIEVAESNRAAQDFWFEQDFDAVGMIRGEAGEEDSMEFERRVKHPEADSISA